MTEQRFDYLATAPALTAAEAAARLLEKLRPEIESLIAANVRFQIEIHAGEGGVAPTVKVTKFLPIN